ncbi:MAG: TetR/AcrR family transcriptional regulator [Candidatus Dormibacteria bacterium]
MTTTSGRIEAAEHAEQVRRQILEGAARAFARSGFQATSVPEIARSAGVSVGLLYRYFASKAELFTAMCQSEMAAEQEALRESLARIANPTERLRHGVEHYLQLLGEPKGAPLILGALAEAPANAEVREVVRLRRKMLMEFIRGYLHAGREAGEVAGDLDLELCAEGIAVMLDGAVASWAAAGPDWDPARTREALVALLARALQRPGSEG